MGINDKPKAHSCQGVQAHVRIGYQSSGKSASHQANIEIHPLLNDQVLRIVRGVAPEALVNFIAKNYDYSGTADLLGVRGQFAELWRKVGKLKKPLWDDEELKFEQAREIIIDLIGHCYLALDYLDQNQPQEEVDDEEDDNDPF